VNSIVKPVTPSHRNNIKVNNIVWLGVTGFTILFTLMLFLWLYITGFTILFTLMLFLWLYVTGFTILFMLMYPVPRQVKVAFHIFGLICFIESLVHIGLTAQASDCVRLYNYFILYVFIHTVSKTNGFYGFMTKKIVLFTKIIK
jgi:hypothetical protein